MKDQKIYQKTQQINGNIKNLINILHKYSSRIEVEILKLYIIRAEGMDTLIRAVHKQLRIWVCCQLLQHESTNFY